MTTQTLTAAQKAWQTRRAKLAGAAAVIAMTAPAPAPQIVKPAPQIAVTAPVAPTAQPEWMKARTKASIARELAAKSAESFEPATELRMVEMYVDDAAIGCGFRRFMVLEQSARLVRLFNVPTLTAITVDRAAFEKKAKAPKFPARKRVLAEILNRNRAMADRINDAARSEIMSDGGVFASRALALLSA